MNTYIIILFVFLLIIIYIFYSYNGINNDINNKIYTKKIVWTYWDIIEPATEIPSYIMLCFDTFKKHLTTDNNYELHILNKDNIKLYLPDLPNLDFLKIAQKTDYIRICLLYKYGGLWLDADTIILKDLSIIFDKLNDYDFVGFGCTGYKCINGYPKPSNWALASRKHSILMKHCMDKLNFIINNYDLNTLDYHTMGKHVIWNSINELQTSINYKYYHFSAEYDGTRDKELKWIHTDNHIALHNTEFINEPLLLFVFLENSKLSKIKEISNINKNDLLYGKYFLSHLFKKSLLY
jgi:hypothetical protein